MSLNAHQLVLLRWFQASASPAAPLSDQQVIFLDRAGRRPTPPYVGLKFTTYDQNLGITDEDFTYDDGSFKEFTRGSRRGTLSITGFGTGAADWMVAAKLNKDRRAVVQILKDAKMSLPGELSPLQNVSRLLDTAIEPRYVQDWEVLYVIETTPDVAVDATTVRVSTALESPPTPLTDTIVVNL